MSDEKVYGVPVTAKGKPGYDFDDYNTPEEHAEIFVWKGKVIWDGAFSTYREIHISIRALYAGLKAGSLSAVPDCPPLWEDEGQYWTIAMLANVAKILVYGMILMSIMNGSLPAEAKNLLTMLTGAV